MRNIGLAFILFLVVAIPARAAWTHVNEWTGTGSKVTETFAIAGKDWRLNWSSKSDGDGLGSISVLVYTADKKLVASASGHVGVPDVTYVHEGPGRYYIEVRAAEVSWTVNTEEDK